VLGTIDPWVATGSGRDPKIQKSVATQNKNPVATGYGSRPQKKIRSRPKKKIRLRPATGRDPGKESGRDRQRVTTGILDRSDPKYNFFKN
jgi:hypothetical protein